MSASLNLLLFVFLYLLLIWKGGKSYPILYIFIFTYFLQYIFSPYLIYNEYAILERQMVISESAYFGYTLPALGGLFAGVLLFTKDVDIRRAIRRIDPQQATRFGYMLLGLSYFLDFLSLIGFSAINSIVSFTSFLKYVGVFSLVFSNSKARFVLLAVVYLQLAYIVLKAGVFINFFIWSTFLFFFLTLRFNVSFLLRASFVVISMPLLIAIQSVKQQYRALTWEGKEEGSVGLLTDLAQKQGEENADIEFSRKSGVIGTVARLNQGWHLGMTMRQVPAQEPFVEGREMLNDIISSILPRLLYPEKKEVNSQAKFEKYTGHNLSGRTSMSIGILGDFYINFGWSGSIIMLFVFGALIAKLVNYFTIRYILPDPINIIWIPFILSYLIRANNDFYIFFNCLVKGFVVFLIVNYARYRWFGGRKPARLVRRPVKYLNHRPLLNG